MIPLTTGRRLHCPISVARSGGSHRVEAGRLLLCGSHQPRDPGGDQHFIPVAACGPPSSQGHCEWTDHTHQRLLPIRNEGEGFSGASHQRRHTGLACNELTFGKMVREKWRQWGTDNVPALDLLHCRLCFPPDSLGSTSDSSTCWPPQLAASHPHPQTSPFLPWLLCKRWPHCPVYRCD